ncbi:MAG: SLC13/DASS family transporter [Clostridiales bacterium]|nr:SLC13/DASS family transporter [Clostridiales bacterium]
MGNDLLALILFVGIVALLVWDRLPMATASIIGCTIMVIAGVCSFNTAFGQFASSTVILTIGVMIIGAAISESGLANAIGNWITRVSQGSEVTLLIGTYLISAALSAFLTNSAVLAIFIPIVMSLSKQRADFKAKNFIMPIAIGCVIGGASTLVGSTQQMTAQGLLEGAGVRQFRTFDFSLVGVILLLVGLVYILLIGRRLGERIWGSRPDEDIEVEQAVIQGSRSKMIIMAVIFGLTIVFYITEWLPLAIVSTSGALLCIATGCITQKKAVSQVNWNIVGRLGACLGIAKALEAAGGTQLISDTFSRLVGSNINPYLLFCILVFLVQFTSEFISNSTAILIVLPIALSIAPDMGLNTYTFALGITLASGACICCPLASSTLGMSMAVGYQFKDYFKYGIMLDIIYYLLIVTLVPLFYGLTV